MYRDTRYVFIIIIYIYIHRACVCVCVCITKCWMYTAYAIAAPSRSLQFLLRPDYIYKCFSSNAAFVSGIFRCADGHTTPLTVERAPQEQFPLWKSPLRQYRTGAQHRRVYRRQTFAETVNKSGETFRSCFACRPIGPNTTVRTDKNSHRPNDKISGRFGGKSARPFAQ